MTEKYEFPDEKEENEKIETGDEGDIELEIVDDTPAVDRGRKPLEREVADPDEKELEEYSDKVQKRIKELTHARHDDRRRAEALARERDELERVSRAAISEVSALRKQLASGGEVHAATLKSAAEAKLQIARKKLKEAHEAFDSDAIIAAQEELNSAMFEKAAAEKFVPPVAQQSETVVDLPHQSSNIPKPDTKTLRWQAQNQWFGQEGFEGETAFALGLHQQLARDKGADFIGTDEYFKTIDARMKGTFPALFGDKARTESEGGSKRPSTVVASAGRTTGKKQVTLTSTQVALAKKLGLTPQQYAAELIKLEK